MAFHFPQRSDHHLPFRRKFQCARPPCPLTARMPALRFTNISRSQPTRAAAGFNPIPSCASLVTHPRNLPAALRVERQGLRENRRSRSTCSAWRCSPPTRVPSSNSTRGAALPWRRDIATITLSRPEKLNAFNTRMMAELVEAIDRTNSDDDVRAVILTGEGRAFCSDRPDRRGGGSAAAWTGPVGARTR